jgi:DNA-binding MarR family transcriptional regulator
MSTNEKNLIVSTECVENIAQGIFQVQPLLKKRLVKLSAIQSEQGIPLSHVQVLAMLEEVGSMSVSEISKRFGIAKPNITPLVDRLVNAGLVDRVRSETDRRVVNIVILEEGRERLRQIQNALNAHVAGWQNTLSAEEFTRLESALADILTILSKI